MSSPTSTLKWKRRRKAVVPRLNGAGNSGLQVARRQSRALLGAYAQPDAEIAFEAAIVGVDGVECGGKERRFHRSEHLRDFIGKIAAGGGVAPVEAVGEQVILGDQIVSYAERMQDQRTGKTGAILAGATMNNQRRTVFNEVSEQRAEVRRVVSHI